MPAKALRGRLAPIGFFAGVLGGAVEALLDPLNEPRARPAYGRSGDRCIGFAAAGIVTNEARKVAVVVRLQPARVEGEAAAIGIVSGQVLLFGEKAVAADEVGTV